MAQRTEINDVLSELQEHLPAARRRVKMAWQKTKASCLRTLFRRRMAHRFRQYIR